MSGHKKMKVCLATAELAPLAKTGGLADVSSALAAYLHRRGHDVRVIMPRYSVMDLSGLDVQPVDFLQNLSTRIGPHRFEYSIDTAVLPRTDLRIYLLRCPALYDREGIYQGGGDEHLRFIALSRVAIDMCQRMGFAPDIFHVHDWHAAIIPLLLKSVFRWDELFRKTRSVLTIHNIGYQGVFGADSKGDLGLHNYEHMLHQDDLAAGRINLLKHGTMYADAISTVSPTYAEQILGDEFGMGLQGILRERRDRMVGILNGVDYDEWSPEKDELLEHSFSADDLSGKVKNKRQLLESLGLEVNLERPVLGMVCRMTVQKGIDIMRSVLPELLAKRDVALTVLGSGEGRYERFFESLQHNFPGRVCFYRGYNNQLAHLIEAGADMFLMPSLYEPCGLNQMYSLRYGTIPIVRSTGGLADSVQLFEPSTGQGTGIVFRDYNSAGFSWAVNAALDLYAHKPAWQRIMQNAMAQNFSWERQGALYEELFRRLIAEV
ncbi:MAG: glycogen synthase [Gammaproteobacteria bacterium]